MLRLPASAAVALHTALALTLPASADFDPWKQNARYELEYQVDLSSLRQDWRLWLPVPADTPAQRLLDLQVEAPVAHRVTRDALGNRTLFLESAIPPGGSARLVARFQVERRPDSGTPAGETSSSDQNDPRRFLGAQRRIPLDGLIEQIALQESQGLESADEKIAAFYDYVYRTMTYSKHGEGWGQGDAVWACTSRYGNCTDFHSLFIGMARSQSIPARFVIGFPVTPSQSEGTIGGYHCWAEVFREGRGWSPLDASEAKKAGRKNDYFGRLPSDRVQFTTGRDLLLEPAQAGPPLNYFVHPYAEIGGVPSGKLPFEVRFRREIDASPTSAGG